MKILFTNQSLVRLGGTQGIIRDLALGLQRRGHTVLAYCSLEPLPGNSLVEDAVPITSTLQTLPFVPDVIHAHNHLFAMTAIMALPGVPAVYCCHGATSMDKQPRHPRIVRYVAMSPTLRLRMAVESGIDENEIEVVYNAVDLHRFRLVRNPPDRPKRALVYKRNLHPDLQIGRTFEKAAALAGVQLEFRGLGAGLTPLQDPEHALLDYDLVFTSGKSAIDALACGCAVIVIGNTSCGEMVCEENFDRLRRANFSAAVNSPPPTVTTILGQIGRYRATELAALTRRLREIASLDAYVERFLTIYKSAIGALRQAPPDPGAEHRAACRYLRSLVPFVKPLDGPPAEHLRPPGIDVLRERLGSSLGAIPPVGPGRLEMPIGSPAQGGNRGDCAPCGS